MRVVLRKLLEETRDEVGSKMVRECIFNGQTGQVEVRLRESDPLRFLEKAKILEGADRFCKNLMGLNFNFLLPKHINHLFDVIWQLVGKRLHFVSKTRRLLERMSN